MLGNEGADWSYDISESLFFLIAIDIMVFYTASSGFRSYILAFFNLASMAIFKASIFIYHTHQYTIGIGMLFFNAHVVGGWWEALLDDGRVVALQTDACPWELYPDPTFIIVICGDTFYCLLWLHRERCLDLLCSHINFLLHLLSYLVFITIFWLMMIYTIHKWCLFCYPQLPWEHLWTTGNRYHPSWSTSCSCSDFELDHDSRGSQRSTTPTQTTQWSSQLFVAPHPPPSSSCNYHPYHPSFSSRDHQVWICST